MNDTFESLKKIIEDYKEIHPDDIYEEASLIDLEIEDKDMEGFAELIENEFGIDIIEDEQFYLNETLEEVISYIERKL